MPSVTINDGQVVYEVVGEGTGMPLALTAGGRFSKDFPGIRDLASQLASSGIKVLLWDRPNCGASDVHFSDRWSTESHMWADTLQQLIKRIGWGPTVLAGGSDGARVAIIMAIEHAEVTSRLVLWHMVGGAYSSMASACYYVVRNTQAANRGGMKAVIELPEWKEQIDQNPNNRERMLSIPTREFVSIMKLWLDAYVPKPGQTIPGVLDDDFKRIDAPTVIIRSGENDDDHPKETSFEVHALIKGSRLVEPPWPEDAWEQARRKSFETGLHHVYDEWPAAAPLIARFCHEPRPA